jgi:hypothetical protein
LPNGVTKQTFLQSSTDAKLNILFDQQVLIVEAIQSLHTKDSNITVHCSDQWKECDDRFKTIEKNWYKFMGGVLIIALLAPFISTYILKLITG